MLDSKKTLYRHQFAIIWFVSSLAFRLLMLPHYLMQVAGRDAWLSMLVLTLIEVALFYLVYKVTERSSIIDFKIIKHIKIGVLLVVSALAVFRILLFLSEAMDFVSANLLDESVWTFAMLALLLAAFYIGYKGGNVLARLAEMVFIFLIIAVGLALLTFRTDMQWNNILPIMPYGSGDMWRAVDRHWIWFIDLTPLLFLSLAPRKKDKDKVSVPIFMVISVVVSVLFMVFFIAVYGNFGAYVPHALLSFSSFTIGGGLSGLMFPLIICWVMCAVIQLSLLFNVVVDSATFVTKKRLPSAIGVFVGIFILMVFFGGVEPTRTASTSAMRIVFLTLEFVVPVLLVALLVYTIKKGGVTSNGKSDSGEAEQAETATGEKVEA